MALGGLPLRFGTGTASTAPLRTLLLPLAAAFARGAAGGGGGGGDGGLLATVSSIALGGVEAGSAATGCGLGGGGGGGLVSLGAAAS